MKKTFFLVSLLFAFQLVSAQETNDSKSSPSPTAQLSSGKKNNHLTPEQKADNFTSKINEAVGLEETQKTKVRSLSLDHFKTMENVRKEANGDKEKIKAEAKKSRKIFNEGLKKVLTPVQFETWKTKRKESGRKQQEAAPINSNEQVDLIED